MGNEEEHTAEDTALSLEAIVLVIGGFLGGATMVFFLGEEDPIGAVVTAAGVVLILLFLSALIWGVYLVLRP